jgi:Na+-translocating ferredoxin:NAD+ oxidoreductase subunit C
VAMGCQIGIATAADAVPVHASVSGIVTEIARYPYSMYRNAVCVTIENDGNDEFSTPIPYDKAWRESAPADIVEKIHLGGIIDNGFPLADRLSQGRAGRVDTLLINALSTEGYCSADARLLIEQPRKAALGITICKYAVGATKCLFVIDENRTTVVDAVSSLMADEEFNDCDCSVLKIKKARYPLHNERLLLAACRGVELPAGALPAEAGCAVIGIAAAVAVAEAVTETDAPHPAHRHGWRAAGIRPEKSARADWNAGAPPARCLQNRYRCDKKTGFRRRALRPGGAGP